MSAIKTRKPPVAVAADVKYLGRLSLRYGRTVLLLTGRGDVPLTPAEAVTLADELRAAAEKAKAATVDSPVAGGSPA